VTNAEPPALATRSRPHVCRPAWRFPWQLGTSADFAAEYEDNCKVPFCREKLGAPNGIRIRAAGLKGLKYLQNRHKWRAML
jgi:hypothetical protein